MRKQLLGLVVLLLAASLTAFAADITGKGAATAQLERVNVARSQDGVRVEFKAKGTLAPRMTTLDSPARIVVDFPNTAMATEQKHISVSQNGVEDIRVATDGRGNTRVVVDLTASRHHELVADGDGFVLKIEGDVQSEAKAPAASPSPAPPAVTSATVQNAVAPSDKPADKATDFAFVEPKFSPTAKDGNANANSNDPKQKAAEAANRFADKTASELVATPVNAAQASAQTAQPAVNLAAEQKTQMMEQKPASNAGKYTGEPISVNLKEVDLRDFFRLIHEISGLNVVLDPNVHGSLTIVLDDVPWDQALDIVLKNNDLSRQLDGNVLRIATIDTLRHEAENRHAQIDAEALAVDKVTITRFLSYAHCKDVLIAVKKFLSQRGDVVADERTNSLIVSDIPAVLPQIDRIVQQMDRKTQEVEIEARVVAATRSFARDIGTQLGFGWGNGSTQVGGVPGGGGPGGSPYTNTSAGNPLYPTFSTGTIPLFSNLGRSGSNQRLRLLECQQQRSRRFRPDHG